MFDVDSIFSKKYMETPPELKGEKQKHNVRTLKKMAEMMVSGVERGLKLAGTRKKMHGTYVPRYGTIFGAQIVFPRNK